LACEEGEGEVGIPWTWAGRGEICIISEKERGGHWDGV
jgi:hypothetical protein